MVTKVKGIVSQIQLDTASNAVLPAGLIVPDTFGISLDGTVPVGNQVNMSNLTEAKLSVGGVVIAKFQQTLMKWLMPQFIMNTSAAIYAGSGSPNTVVTASPGSVYLNQSGGANVTLYIKESGVGNTGWVAK